MFGSDTHGVGNAHAKGTVFFVAENDIAFGGFENDVKIDDAIVAVGAAGDGCARLRGAFCRFCPEDRREWQFLRRGPPEYETTSVCLVEPVLSRSSQRLAPLMLW